jgi:hypothetical protein
MKKALILVLLCTALVSATGIASAFACDGPDSEQSSSDSKSKGS